MPSVIYPQITAPPTLTTSPVAQTFLVAANDAPAGVKAAANYLCDATADEVQINAALDALSAFGGAVRLSEGTFNIASPILVVEASSRLIGAGTGTHGTGTQAGRGTMIKAAAGFSGTELVRVQLAVNDKPVVGVTIRDLSINGDDVAGPIDGVLFRSNFGRMVDCHITNCSGYGVRIKGYAAWTTYDTRMVNLLCAFNGLAGILLDTDSADCHIIGCVLEQNTQDGLEVKSGSNQMIGGQYYGNGRYGILFNSAGSNSMVTGIKIENNAQHGILIDAATAGPTGVIITGCGFRLNGKLVNNTYDHISTQGASAIPNLTIVGNRFSSSPSTDPDLPRYGVNLFGNLIQNALVAGNVFATPIATHFGTDAVNYGPGSSNATPSLVRDNIGAPDAGCMGTGAITSAATSVVITHRQPFTPSANEITITPTNNPTNDPGNIWVSAIGATTFTVNCRNAPGASTLTFAWRVK